MRRAVAIVVAASALAAPAAYGREPPHVAVGIAEPDPGFFDDARFHGTGIRNARLLVPWDVVKMGGWPLHVADVWLERARRDGVEPLVSFGHSMSEKRQRRLPSVREYAKQFRAFRERYPWVREFSTWNEANLGSKQPTGRHPRRTAVFYRALKKQCRGCTVVAVELLVTSNWRMWRWIRAFRKRAGPGRLIFGLHNYPDVTRLRSRGTRRFLRLVKNADVWITETGGIVRHRRFKYDEDRAARVVRYVFRLVSRLPRVERLYLYHWRYGGNATWDSALISQDGTERKAYYALLDGLSLDRFKPVPVPVADPIIEPLPPPAPEPPPEPPPADPPAAEGG
jgi:polysaccharide biosynthesis protein PslG